MAETTTATAGLAPPERSMPIGYRFSPTDQEIVGHYLRHKLVADDPSINEIIPEVGICNHEPWDLLAWAASASTTKFDKSECLFFRPRDYKYSNSTRWNRTTLGGFWKITGQGQEIHCKDTNKVIGTKKILVYHEGRVSHGIKTNWVIHEYHDSQLPLDQRTYVLCWLRNNQEKKTKEKRCKPSKSSKPIHKSSKPIHGGRQRKIKQNKKTTEYVSEEQYISNKRSKNSIDSMIQTPPLESIETIESEIPVSPKSSKAINLAKQISLKSCKPINLTKQVSTQLYTTIKPMDQIELDEELTSIVHTDPIESNSTRAVDSMIQNELLPLITHSPTIAVGSMMETSFKPNELLPSITPSMSFEPNSSIETSFDASEFGFSLLDFGESDFTSLMQSPRIEEQWLEPNSSVETSTDASEFGFSLFDFGESDFTLLLQSPKD